MTALSIPPELPVSEWKRYRTRPIAMEVSFASSPQIVDTLEGPVRCAPGDAIVTGVKGEKWPVQRRRFEKTYVPVQPTRLGQAGLYCKKPREVKAGRLVQDYQVTLSEGRGVLNGLVGDILVEYSEGDQSIIAPDIFEKTYQSVID